MRRFLRQVVLIAHKDLRIENRSRELVPTMTLFAVLVTVLSSMALYIDDRSGPEVAPGVLWIAIAFSGTLGLARSWDREREEGALRGLLLSPASPRAILLGKTLSSLAFVLFTELIVAPLVALLLRAPVFDYLAPFSLLVLLGTVGFVSAGALFGALTARTRARDLQLATALYPLVSPALLCGVVATRELFHGVPLSALTEWLKLLVAFDAICVLGGAWLIGWLLAD